MNDKVGASDEEFALFEKMEKSIKDNLSHIVNTYFLYDKDRVSDSEYDAFMNAVIIANANAIAAAITAGIKEDGVQRAVEDAASQFRDVLTKEIEAIKGWNNNEQ